ncbi:SulP family inorganic anion transporter [Oxalobacteraceae bacterium R-40]|uniref:SulP family inorganic anion transporter n=1 Tax=Keguizhuia sedimenti TaxID=3064264 RepID=A0ABU1BN12_9BURK|nr:SulP family inorganic anion transporter [Oxalobacteraceae bacterium R-40]
MNPFRLRFHPRLLEELRVYDRGKFYRDLSAGLTVGVVALPLAMAFAIASGVKPEAGIFTAIIAGFLISVLGGSRVQIGGPAGAYIVIIYGIVQEYGLANLLIATMFAGVLLLCMGLLKLGAVIRYVPIPIVIGFTNGIAVLIALSQLKDFFGLRVEKMPADFFAQIHALASNAHTFNSVAILIALLSLILLFFWSRVLQMRTDRVAGWEPGAFRIAARLLGKIPATIIVLILSTLAVWAFNLPVDTIGTRFGGIPRTLPYFDIPEIKWSLLEYLFAPALTIALLGAIESLLCARVADNLIGDRHDPNQELMAQGIANIVAPFFGGIPATGTIARTVTNIRSGAATPVAGIVHALVLLLIVIAAAPLAQNIPLSALASILLFVAFNMGEWHEFSRLRHFSVRYRIQLLATFLLTVMVDLTVAMEVGLVLACVFFIYRISSLTQIRELAPSALPAPLPDGVAAYSIFGSLFFGAVDKLESLVSAGEIPPKALILELHQLINIDTTGLDMLDNVRQTLHKHGSRLIICAPNDQPLDLMRRSGFLKRLGSENCVDSLAEAISLTA